MTGAVHEGLVEHAAIDKAFHALLEAIDQPGAAAAFEDVAERLRHHLGSEDIDIAQYASVDAEDAKALLAEHESFRETLRALGEHAKAGTLAPKEIHELKLRFSLHEAREETGLYRWAAARSI